MNRLNDLPFFDDGDMPIQGAYGVSSECQAQLCPDSMTGYEYHLARQRAEQRKVSKDFLTILETVKAGTYGTLREFGESVGKSQSWVASFRKVAISTHCLTGQEWRSYFKRGERGPV